MTDTKVARAAELAAGLGGPARVPPSYAGPPWERQRAFSLFPGGFMRIPHTWAPHPRGRLPWRIAVLVLGLTALGQTGALAQAPTHVVGQVQDSITQRPIAGVRVGVKGTAAGTMTDANGHFALDVPAGRDSLSFKRIGYRSVVRNVAP